MEEKYALKIISENEKTAIIGGIAVVYGGRDLEGDTFTELTDFMDEHASDKMPVLYDHALGEIKNTLGVVTKVERKDFGLWMEAQIDRSKAYATEVLELVKKGLLGYSTGSVTHLVQRLEGQIKRWPIYELSLTPTPAEPRTLGVEFIKTLGLEIDHLPDVDIIAIEGEEPKIADVDSDVILSRLFDDVKNKTETIMSDEVTNVEEPKEPEIQEPKVLQEAEVEAMIKSAMDKLAESHVTEPSGILTESAPAIKKVTKIGGDHTGADAFNHWCRTGQENYYTKGQGGNVTKADLAEGALATGGVLVPEDMYATIIAKRNEASVPHRAGAMIINTSLDSIQVPTENASSAFTLTAEAGTYSTSDPSFTSNIVTVYKYTSTTKASQELLSDQVANLDAFLADGWARGLAQAYNQYTILGTGSGQPQGVMVGGTAALTFDATTTIAAAEIPELYHKLPDYYSEGATWLTRNSTLGILRGLTGNPFLFNPTPQGDAPYGSLYGKRVLLSDKVAAATAGLKAIIVANWQFYALVERSSLEVLRDPYSSAASGQVCFYCNARFGGKVLLADAFQYGTMKS